MACPKAVSDPLRSSLLPRQKQNFQNVSRAAVCTDMNMSSFTIVRYPNQYSQDMKKITTLILAFCSLLTYAQNISDDTMRGIYEEVKSPYKYGMVIAPADNGHKIDCPTVYREGNKWYMTYVVYNGSNGTDGRGYTTWLA